MYPSLVDHSNFGKFLDIRNHSIWTFWWWSFKKANYRSGICRKNMKKIKILIFFCIFKLFTMSLLHLILLNVISSSMCLAYILVPWNIGYWFDFIFHYLRVSYSLYVFICFVEYIILKYSTEFIWKRVPPLNQEFTSICINILNSFMSLVFGIIEIVCSFEIDTLEYEKMIGPIAYRTKMTMQKSRYLLNTSTCTWYNLLLMFCI